jgi:hypothetical protein
VSLFKTALAPVAGEPSASHVPDGTPTKLLADEIDKLPDSGGYPSNRPDLDAFLTTLDDPEWQQALSDSAGKPTGVFIDPNEHTFGSFHNAVQALQTFRKMAQVSALLGLKAQRDGDPAEFVERLRVLLAVVNTTRDRGPYVAVFNATNAEAFALAALDRWLASLRGRPDLLRTVLATLAAHDAAVTANFLVDNAFYAEQMILRNSLNSPSQWLPQELAVASDLASAEVQTEIIAFLWAVPWERARLERAIGHQNAYPVKGPGDLAGVPGLGQHAFLINYSRNEVAGQRPLALARIRARVVAVAARLFEAERGRFPKSADELVPAYLPAIPADPYGTAAINYRIAAKAESLVWEGEQTVTIPGDPLGSIVGGQLMGDDYYRRAAEGVGALAGSVVFRNTPQPLVNDAGQATAELWSPPSPTPTTVRQGVRIRLAVGQPVAWSVGPDGRDGGGLYPARETPRRSVPQGDLVFPVPLPAPAR